MNTELQQKHREKPNLKRDGVLYRLEKSIKQKSVTVTKRHES